MKNNNLLTIAIVSVLLLLVPLIAMQFTEEVKWTLVDFAIAGALLFGTGLLVDLAIRNVENVNYRIAIIVALSLVLLIIWAELAVGIF